MTTVAITNKLAKQMNVLIQDEDCSDIDFYVHTIEIGGEILVIIVRPDTFYSYTTIVDVNEEPRLDKALKNKIATSNIKYILAKNKSDISKLTTVGKKYKQLLFCAFEQDTGPVKLEEIEKIANITPWKFLEFRSPEELERAFFTSK